MPVRPGFDFVHDDVLQGVPVRERFADALGRVGLAGPQHVGEVLGIGVQPRDGDADVAVQHVAALDDGVVAEIVGALAAALDLDARLKPRLEPEVVDALAPPPHEVAGLGLARRHHRRREHRLRERPHELLHPAEEHFLLRQADGHELERQVLGVAEFRAPFFADRGRHPLQLAARQAVGKCENSRPVDADRPRIPFFDDGLQRHPLLVAPELGLLAAAHVRRRRPHRAARFEDAALRGATERDPFHARG